MQVYIKDSKEAVTKYLDAFKGEIVSQYLNESGGYYHCEIKIDDVVLAISEVNNAELSDTLSVMQFCLHYEEHELYKISHAFEVLEENAVVHFSPNPTDYAKLMVDFTDQFGVRWCLFG